MFFRFAFGDSESNIIRDKVILIFLRYFLLFYLSFLAYVYKSFLLLILLSFGIISYLLWAIAKNSRYIKNRKKFLVLPLLQITSDFAVILGTVFGVLKKISIYPFRKQIFQNWKLLLVFIIYILTTLSAINWGIPSNNHPFLYHMDEWHQLQSVRFVFKYGSPNFPGAANGTMFHFFLSGLMLIPFILLHIVNPFAIKSAVGNISVQHTLFMVLRLNTLFFGVLAMIFLHKISKLLRLNSILVICLFTFTPVWLMLSNNFKYDIALIFWLVLSFYYILRYSKTPTTRNFIIAGVVCGLSLSVKVSAIPILLLYIVSFLLFTPSFFKNIKRIFLGLFGFLITLIFFGIPDFVFTGRNMFDYLKSNIIEGPLNAVNLNVGSSTFNFIFFHHLPTIFGHSFFYLFIFASAYILYTSFKGKFIENSWDSKVKLFIYISFIIFFLSLTPFLGIGIGANRALPLLPLMVLIIGIFFQKVFKQEHVIFKKFLLILLSLVIVFQTLESYLWVGLKFTPAPQQTSSKWILSSIPRNTTIGIESIPLYQFEPDIVLKEFYNEQYKTNLKLKYNYLIVNGYSKKLPPFVIVSNVKLSLEAEKKSPKKDLIKRLQKEKYQIVKSFSPSYKFFYLFGNNFNYVYSGLLAYPEDITIYKK